jgi:hypothetical protein
VRVSAAWRTQIVVWEVADPAKAGDSRFWWTAEEVGRLRRVVPPEHADRLAIAGTPKGRSLAAWRRETPPEPPFRVSLDHWRDADPDKTYLIVSATRGPTPEEEQREGLAERLPPEIEDLRQAWVAALQSGDDDEPMLREQLDAELEAIGHFRRGTISAFDPRKAVEISPGVFVQDERRQQWL